MKKNKKWRTRFVDVCRTISDNAQFNQLVILAICAVGVLEALSANGATYAWMRPTQLSIIALFTLEVTVKLIALGRRDYFRDGWNRFDFAIVAVSDDGAVIEVTNSITLSSQINITDGQTVEIFGRSGFHGGLKVPWPTLAKSFAVP